MGGCAVRTARVGVRRTSRVEQQEPTDVERHVAGLAAGDLQLSTTTASLMRQMGARRIKPEAGPACKEIAEAFAGLIKLLRHRDLELASNECPVMVWRSW